MRRTMTVPLVETGGLAAAHRHRANRARSCADGRGIRSRTAEQARRGDIPRRCAALLPDCARRTPRLETWRRSPRVGFEMTLAANAGIFGRRVPRSLSRQGRAATVAAPHGFAAGQRFGACPLRRPAHPRSRARLTSIDAANWPAVVEAAGLSGMVRQLALNCVPARFEKQPAEFETRSGRVGSAHAFPSRRNWCKGCPNILAGRYASRFETADSDLNSPARQRVPSGTGPDRARAASAFESDPVVKGLRERFRRRCGCILGQTKQLATEAGL